MKKLLALVLASVLLLGVPVAYGEESETHTDRIVESPTTVSLTIDESLDSFVVVIPATLVVDPTTKTGSMEVTLQANWQLVSSQSLGVWLQKSANGRSLVSNDGVSVGYTLAFSGSANGEWDGKPKQLIMAPKAGDKSQPITVTLTVTVESLPTKGVYTDTLTFAIT